MECVIEGKLMGSYRPGYGIVPKDAQVNRDIVDEWIDTVKAEGIISIICLLADEHLKLYESLPGGLLEYYRNNGFKVVSVPIRDYQQPAINQENLLVISDAYCILPKPVLIHCSAGVDRTGAAIRYIMNRF